MSASEFIHPDWIDGYRRVRNWLPWKRKPNSDRLDERFLLPSGEALIFDGPDIRAPARKLGDRSVNYEHQPEIGAMVEDKHGHLWVITRFVNYNGQNKHDYWERCTRVYAKRADA